MKAAAAGPEVHPDLAAYLALVAEGDAFAAHEALEAAWRRPGDALARVDAVRALIQVAAAYVHRRRGNERGARLLAVRATEGLRRPCPAAAARCLAAAGIDREALATRLAALGPEPARWPDAFAVVLGGPVPD